MTELYIKNMVCDRCIKVVTGVLNDIGLEAQNIQLGKATLKKQPTAEQMHTVQESLQAEGFELLDDHRIKLVEQIKQLIINLVHYSHLDEFKENLSYYLSKKLQRDYHYLTNLFSSIENTTVEQYFILQKIEKVKELLVYDELSLSEIAYQLGYSSVAHLSSQFKK